MELRDLEYFVVVAEHGRLTNAASVLRISQPALSKSIARLEDVLEVKLFTRSQSGMALTAEGELLLSRARDLRLSLRNVAGEVTDLSRGRAGHIRIGVGPSMDDELVIAAICDLMKDAPRLTVKIVVADGDEIEPALRAGRLDVIINFKNGEGVVGFEHSPLYTDEYVVCCSPSHRLIQRKKITLGSLAEERWAIPDANLGSQRRLFDTFRAHGLAPPVVTVECRVLGLRMAASINSSLLIFASRRIVQRAIQSGAALTTLSVEGLEWRPLAAAMYRNEQYVHPAVLRLIELLRTAALNGIPSEFSAE